MQLVPITTMEEIEHALLAMQIADMADELQRLRLELAPLENAFSAFERQVAHEAASTITKRDHLRNLCHELEQFTVRLHARLEADPDGQMSSVFTPDELAHIGELFGIDVPEDWFDTSLHATTPDSGWQQTEESIFTPRHPSLRTLPEADAVNLRTLYRQLARAFHPDLTVDSAERHFRQEIMLRINHAWDLRDLHLLRSIRDDVNDLLTGHLASAHAYRLAWQRRELSRLMLACEECRNRLAALRTSKTVVLWHDAALARSAIARHISRLEDEIALLATRRDTAVEEFRLALGAYSARRM